MTVCGLSNGLILRYHSRGDFYEWENRKNCAVISDDEYRVDVDKLIAACAECGPIENESVRINRRRNVRGFIEFSMYEYEYLCTLYVHKSARWGIMLVSARRGKKEVASNPKPNNFEKFYSIAGFDIVDLFLSPAIYFRYHTIFSGQWKAPIDRTIFVLSLL